MESNHTGLHHKIAVMFSATAFLLFVAALIALVSPTFVNAGTSGNPSVLGVLMDRTNKGLPGPANRTAGCRNCTNQRGIFPGALGVGKFSSLLVGTSTLPANALFVIATSSNIMTVLSDGSVGIGTATPDQDQVALDVNGPIEALANTGYGGPAVEADTNNAYDYAFYGTNQQHQWGERNDAGDLADLFNRQDGTGLYIDNMFYSPLAGNAVLKLLSRPTSPVGDLILANSGAYPGVEKFAVDTTGGAYFAGNVGIGTTDPSASLQIAGTLPTLRIGAASLAGCIEVGNSDGSAGINYITVLNGIITATTTKPNMCQ
jgi:hypothetical protein